MEELTPLRLSIPSVIRDLVKSDSKALGIPAYSLYIKILEDFVRKSAKERKSIYIRRIRRGSK